MNYFKVFLIATLSLTELTACDTNYYYPDSPAPRRSGGYIARDSYGTSDYNTTRVRTSSGYMVNHGDRYSQQRGGYIERDSY